MKFNHTKKCVYCNKQFHSQREDAKFCSSTCRSHFHLNKSNVKAIAETFQPNVLSIKNVSKRNKQLFSDIVNKDVLYPEELETIVDNKKTFLKLFLLSNKEEIEEIVDDLNLFSEDDYATLSVCAQNAMEYLMQIEENPNIVHQLLPEIKKLTYKYENL